MMYVVESTAKRRVRKLHQEFDNFTEARKFLNKCCRRPECDVLMIDRTTGEVLAIKNSLVSEVSTYYADAYKQLVSVNRRRFGRR